MEKLIKSDNEYGIPSHLVNPCLQIIATHTFVSMSNFSTLYHISPTSLEQQIALLQSCSTYTEEQWATIMAALQAHSENIDKQRAILNSIDEAARTCKVFSNRSSQEPSNDYSLLFAYSSILFGNPALIYQRCSVFQKFIETVLNKKAQTIFWFIPSDDMRYIFEHLILTEGLDIPLTTHWIIDAILFNKNNEIRYFINLVKENNPFIFPSSQSNFAKIISNTDIKKITYQSLHELYEQINPPLEWVMINVDNDGSDVRSDVSDAGSDVSDDGSIEPLARAFMQPSSPTTATKKEISIEIVVTVDTKVKTGPSCKNIELSDQIQPSQNQQSSPLEAQTNSHPYNRSLKPEKSCLKSKTFLTEMMSCLWKIFIELARYLYFKDILLLTFGKSYKLRFSPDTDFSQKRPRRKLKKSSKSCQSSETESPRLTANNPKIVSEQQLVIWSGRIKEGSPLPRKNHPS